MAKNGKEQINGLLDRGCNFEGKLTFDGVVQINGDFRGEVFSDGTLVVGSDAHINAKILVDTLIVDGSVEGNVEAKSKIELHRSGTLVADVVSQSFVIEDGGVFQGSCQMPSIESRRTVNRQRAEGEEVFIKGERRDDQMVM
jgi:cytoskeletal protein CcmA (bactofilin family)